MIRALFLTGLLVLPGMAVAQILLTPEEIQQTLSHGPWPPQLPPDASNRASGRPDAVALGRAMFSAPVLSANGQMACASCHDPGQHFTDGLPRAEGATRLDRNTPSLFNLPLHRWFGWAGDSDNLWAQSLLPILNADEMAQTPEGLKSTLQASPLAEPFETVFGPLNRQTPTAVLVNTGKALAAYQETLITGRTAFDRFRDALQAGDLARAGRYPAAAQRGLKTFLGRGRCNVCHSGPAFTNGEFHDAGLSYFITETRVDSGRHGGLAALLRSPFTLDSAHSDDPRRSGAWAVRRVRRTHADFGTFRVPGLRGAAHTAPYMHNGSLPDLAAVVRHYNGIDPERLHTDGEAILAPIGLSEEDIADLVFFLETLSNAR